jgi:16S rRNA G527 N7-methylase RsmG
MQKELAQNSQNKAYSQYAEKFKELNEKLNLIKSKKSGTEKAKA